MMEPLTHRAFLGYILYQKKCGDALAPRWLCLREEIRQECYDLADKYFLQWSTGELAMKEEREKSSGIRR